MPTALIGAGIGGVTSIIGGLLGSHAANSAASIQSQNAQRVAQMAQQAAGTAAGGVTTAADNAQQQMRAGLGDANFYLRQGQENSGNLWNQQQGMLSNNYANLNPYLQAGQQGIAGLSQAFAPGGSLAGSFKAPTAAEAEATPGYQFQMQQGLKALNSSQAAQGLTASGGALKALTQYGQGLASTNYQNTYNNALQSYQTNFGNTLNGLGTLAGYGQNANNQAINLGGQFNQAAQNYGGQYANLSQGLSGNTIGAAQYGGNIGLQGAQSAGQFGLEGARLAGDALTGGANARAAGTVGSANAWQSALGGVGNAAQYYGLSQMMQPQSMSTGGFDPSGGVPGGVPYLGSNTNAGAPPSVGAYPGSGWIPQRPVSFYPGMMAPSF